MQRVNDLARSARTAPAVVLAAALGATAYVATVNPEQPGHYPTCPFLSLSGLYCPGCGSLRALHALTNGDVATAIDRNVLAVAAVPMLAAMWVQWARRTRTGHPTAGNPAAGNPAAGHPPSGRATTNPATTGRAATGPAAPVVALWGLVGLVLAFWVLRNVPAGSWLAP